MVDPTLSNAALITVAALASSFMSFALSKIWQAHAGRKITFARNTLLTILIVVVAMLLVFLGLSLMRNAIF